MFQKQADAFLSQHRQMPTNLNKMLYSCRLVNCQTNVKKFVSKNENIPKINNRPKFYMIFARKSNKIPIMYMIFD